ncbi:MAG: DUF3854 domain-containing protein [Chloroflexi bacterium]|nr:DUF3854 domain-containing protein [Chloroflexota bacterium]
MTAAIVSKWVRVNRHNPCPVCGKPDWCLVSGDGKAAICARIESDKPAGNKGAGWLHKLDATMPLPPLPTFRPDPKQTPKAAPDVLDKTYNALLEELQLSAIHRASLQRRGLTDAQIDSLCYRTLPPTGRGKLIIRLETRSVRLAGVPGFYLEAGQCQLAGPVGILIPVRDIKKRIVGLQVRCDEVGGGKYKWLSSKGFNAGCSPGAPVHVAGLVSNDSEMWITEGPLKADIAALKLGHLVLAVPGVGNWRGVIPIVRQLRPKRIVIAFDEDKNRNTTVRLHLDTLAAFLIRFGLRTFEADWDTRFKGLDDLLTGD